MLRSQRILITVGLLFAPYFLHVNLCDWKFKEHMSFGWESGARAFVQEPICAWDHKLPASVRYYTGLSTQSGVDFADAVVFGVVLPLLMLMLVMYLWLGWWHNARIARGLCAACGYDLRGAPDAARCPECGARRRGHKVDASISP